MLLDVHNHAIPHSAIDLLDGSDAFGVSFEGGRWEGGMHPGFPMASIFWDTTEILTGLESHGLEGGVISPAPPLFLYHVEASAGEEVSRATNEGMADLIRHDPERLGWMATVPLQSPERAVTVLRDAAAAGAVGVEVGTSIHTTRLDDPSLDPFWAEVTRLSLPAMLHPAYNMQNPALAQFHFQNVIGNQMETTVAIERLLCAGTLDRHPELRLMLVHAGGYFPWQAGRLRHAHTVRPELEHSNPDPWSYLDRLWFDVITHDDQVLEMLISRVGVERLVMGTDLPFDMATPEPLEALKRVADEEAVTAICERNPATLFGLG